VSGPLQLTIAASNAPAPQPGPDGTSEPVEGAVDSGQPGGGPDLPPVRITFGPGPSPTPAPPSGGQPPQSGDSGSGRSGTPGATGSGDGSAGPARTRRPARTGAGRRPTPGPATGPRAGRRPSRLGQLVSRLRSGGCGGRVATGSVPAIGPVRAPRPGRVAGGRSLLGWLGSALAGLLRSGQVRASRLTPEDWWVIGILAVALIVAFGGQVNLGALDPAQTPIAAPAGATTTARQVLDLAEAQVGTVESRGGGTPYHRDYGIAPDQPWCAVFLWDMFREAGAADLIGPKTAYTPTLANYFREHGQWSSTPTVGALVFYDWPSDGRNRIQHVGIVEAIGPNTIQTIEANTSSGVAGSQANGGGVWRRTRPRNGSIVGYGLPSYALAA
jgi:hypothetical protein